MNQSETEIARAEAVERRSELQSEIAKLANQIRENTAEFAPSVENPAGKAMSAKQWEAYELLAQRATIANNELTLAESQLKRLESNADHTDSLDVRQRNALTAFARGRTMTAEQEAEFIIPLSDDDTAKYPTAGAQFKIKAAMTRSGAGGDNSGAAAVPEHVAENVLVQNMMSYGGISQLVSLMSTDHGRNIEVPNVDATAQAGIRIAEGVAAGDLDLPDLGVTTLKAWIYASKVATVSHQLLRDASFNVVDWMEGSLVRRNAVIIQSECTTGAGDSRPTGMIDQLQVGHTAADDTTFTWQELLELYGSIDDLYLDPAGHGLGTGGEVAWAMNKPTLLSVMQIADTQNRPLYLPDLNGRMGVQLFGYPIRKVHGMANIVADSKSIAFGNFGFYILRATEDTRALRFDDSAYAKRGVSGFLVFNEADGRWIQALTADKVTCAKVLQMGDGS